MFLTPSFTADVLLLGTVILMIGHAWRRVCAGTWMLLDPLNAFWAGILICFVQRPISEGETFFSWHGEDLFVKTLAALFLGVLCVIGGFELKIGTSFAAKLPAPPPRLAHSRILFAAITLIAVGVSGYMYLFDSAGGVWHWLQTPRGGTDYENISGYWAQFSEFLPAGVGLLLFAVNQSRSAVFARSICWLLAAAVLLWLFYLGSRSRLITFVILCMTAYYLPRQRSPHLLIAMTVGLLLYTGVKFQERYRDTFYNLSFNLKDAGEENILRSLLPTPLGGTPPVRPDSIGGSEFNCAMSTISLVPDVVPYNYGYGALEIFTRPIPRAVWKDKRYPHIESVQGVLKEAELSNTTVETATRQELLMGPAFGFLGHWYYVAGVLGVIVGGVLTGVLLRLLYFSFARAPDNQSMQIIYPMLIGIGFSEAASTPLLWMCTVPFVLLPYLGILYLCAASNPLAASGGARQHSLLSR